MNKVEITKNLISLNDVKIYIEDTGGNGYPVILIHGWPLSLKSWEKQVPALSTAGYRVITYDCRGFGQSEKSKTGYDFETLAGDLMVLIEALKLRTVTLVGFSMGGGEVARYVAVHGEDRLKAIVFASAIVPMMMKTPDNPNGPLEPTKAEKMINDLAEDSDVFFDQFTKDFFFSTFRWHYSGN